MVGEIKIVEVEFKLVKVRKLRIKEALEIFVEFFFSNNEY
jgi:hypothetical protein